MKISKIQTNFRSHKLMVCISLFLILFISGALKAATINVSSVPALQIAINNSTAGDVIVLADGTYFNSTLNIGKSNIKVKSATPGGVFLNGTNNINITGNYITFSGFQFTSGDIGQNYLIEVSGSHNTLSQLNFNGYVAKKFIDIEAGSQYNTIEYCNISKLADDNVNELGCAIQIHSSPSIPGYHKISYCSFQNFTGNGGDYGNEPIRIGLSTENDNVSRTLVEHCYFNNTGDGDSESVSVKSKENIIRFCTFTNQQNAMLVFRNGDNNIAYSNFFINAGGIRVKEANNIFCYNNYFYNSGTATGANSSDAVTLVYVDPIGLRTSNLVNVNFIHNTFVNCGYINLGGTGATSNTWANTIFQKSSGSIFKNANSGTTWVGNIYQGTLGISISTGMTNTDPLLVSNGDGYMGLSSNSPAIDAANTAYPAILDIPVIDDDTNLLFDISGQARPSAVTLKDVGCDEYTTGATTNHPLTLSEVGPSYLFSLATDTFELFDQKITIFPNPVKNNFTIQFSETFTSDIEVMVFNISGQVVKKQIVSQNDIFKNKKKIDVADLEIGIYLVRLNANNYSKTLKIVIQK
jgi:hypothetical protein